MQKSLHSLRNPSNEFLAIPPHCSNNDGIGACFRAQSAARRSGCPAVRNKNEHPASPPTAPPLFTSLVFLFGLLQVYLRKLAAWRARAVYWTFATGLQQSRQRRGSILTGPPSPVLPAGINGDTSSPVWYTVHLWFRIPLQLICSAYEEVSTCTVAGCVLKLLYLVVHHTTCNHKQTAEPCLPPWSDEHEMHESAFAKCGLHHGKSDFAFYSSLDQLFSITVANTFKICLCSVTPPLLACLHPGPSVIGGQCGSLLVQCT